MNLYDPKMTTRASVAAFECFLYRNNIRFMHLVSNSCTAEWAQRAFVDMLGQEVERQEETVFRVCHPSGAGSEHFPVLIIEDREFMDPSALKEAMLIAAPDKTGFGPITIEFT